MGGLLTFDSFKTVIGNLPLYLHDYYGIRQRNKDLQASGTPQCQGNHKKVSKEVARSGLSKMGFGFSCMRGEKKTTAELRKNWKFRWKSYSSSFEEWVRLVAPTVRNPFCWAPGRVAVKNESSLRGVAYRAREVFCERFQQMGFLVETLPTGSRGEGLDRSAS